MDNDNPIPTLKPCPFCGSPPNAEDGLEGPMFIAAANGDMSVICFGCLGRTAGWPTKELAAVMWNSRAPISARLKSPPEQYCAKCGAPKSNHPYRHPFTPENFLGDNEK